MSMRDTVQSVVNESPRLRSILRPLYYRYVLGLPRVYPEGISDADLRACISGDAPCILEIGANNGADTMRLKRMFPRSVIHCFEPDSRAIRKFKETTCGSDGIHLHEFAIGATSGNAKFFPSVADLSQDSPRQWDLSGSLREPTGHKNLHPSIIFGDPISVPTMTLDDWCARVGVRVIDFIWMDVQGAEMDVFRGGEQTLAKTRYLYTEYAVDELYSGQSSLSEILNCLTSFKTVKRFPDDILLRNTEVA